MTETEVRAAIEALYGESLSNEGCDTLEALLRELVAPGRADVHRAAVIEVLSP